MNYQFTAEHKKWKSALSILVFGALLVTSGFRVALPIVPEPTCTSCGSVDDCISGVSRENGYPECFIGWDINTESLTCSVSGEQGACSPL